MSGCRTVKVIRSFVRIAPNHNVGQLHLIDGRVQNSGPPVDLVHCFQTGFGKCRRFFAFAGVFADVLQHTPVVFHKFFGCIGTAKVIAVVSQYVDVFISRIAFEILFRRRCTVGRVGIKQMVQILCVPQVINGKPPELPVRFSLVLLSSPPEPIAGEFVKGSENYRDQFLPKASLSSLKTTKHGRDILCIFGERQLPVE